MKTLTATLWTNKSKVVKSLYIGLLFSLSVVWAQQSPIAENATPTLYADGLQFTEGPLWTGDGLLVSDIYANAIYKVTKGNIEVWLEPSGHANGLVQTEEGDIIIAQHDRAVSQVDGKTLNVLANSYEGDKLNSPNDLALSRSGRVYFTDPTFGLLGPPLGLEGQEAELDFSGVYRLEEDGNVTLLADDLAAPNGLAFSPDELLLYVSDTATQALYVYDVAEDGTLLSGRLFYQFDTSLEGNADGLEVDGAGNLFATAPGGLVVLSPEAEVLVTVPLPQVGTNVAFGGPDGRTLFITAGTAVYALPLEP